MQSFFSAIMAFFMAVLSFFGIGGDKPAKKNEFRVTTYIIANETNENSIHAEDFDIITDVILFGGATFDQKGQVHETEQLSKALDIIREKIGDRDVKIHLNLLGPGAVEEHDEWADHLRDLAQQHNIAFDSGVLEENIVALANKYDFDGVYFDYEYPMSKSDWNRFGDFLISIDKLLGDKYLGAAVSTDINLPLKAIKVVDRFEAMLYDVYDKKGNHSTYETAIGLVPFFTTKGVPLHKLDFGLPFYARPTDNGPYWYGYKDNYYKLDSKGYMYDERIDKTFWFNTPDVIAKKTEYAIRCGLGGVMCWAYTYDLPSSNEASLLRAVGETVNNTYIPVHPGC